MIRHYLDQKRPCFPPGHAPTARATPEIGQSCYKIAFYKIVPNILAGENTNFRVSPAIFNF